MKQERVLVTRTQFKYPGRPVETEWHVYHIGLDQVLFACSTLELAERWCREHKHLAGWR